MKLFELFDILKDISQDQTYKESVFQEHLVQGKNFHFVWMSNNSMLHAIFNAYHCVFNLAGNLLIIFE